MTKKFSAPLERTARLLDLVPYITAHQGISIKQLSETFEVSQSQMINDLTTLWMCGLPGYTPLELMDLDFESGYVTINNAETLSKPRSITFNEGVALVLGLDLIRSTIDEQRTDLLQSIDSLSDRLRALIKMPAALSAKSAVNHEVSSSLNEAIRIQSGLFITPCIATKSQLVKFCQLKLSRMMVRVISAPIVIPHLIFDSFGSIAFRVQP
jgi:proteasome accessory factor C